MSRFSSMLNVWLLGLPIAVAVFVVLAVMCFTLPGVLLACCVAYAFGLYQLSVAKFSMFRQGVLVSFGPGRMTVANRQRYRRAYVVMGTAVLVNLLLTTMLAGA